jgi:dipeptidase
MRLTIPAPVLVMLLALPGSLLANGCSTILVTAGASEDGSLFVTHSDDNELMDQRIVFVPAMDHEPGSVRNVYCTACALGEYPEYNCYMYPRIVCTGRGDGYDAYGYDASTPLGTIPQVPHTYAYFDGSYGIMNEHQLMIGECTNGAKIQLGPEPGRRIFYSSELSRVALERCTTAREAVELMGSLIEEYGYYGTGETLLVGDPVEGWVLEMCCGTVDSTGGLWVAKRVPDGQVFVAANEFRIRTIDPDDPGLLYCDDLFEQVQAMGWWDPSDGPLDWLRAVSLGEYNHPYYSLRRVWRVLSTVAPSLGLDPWVEDGYTTAYPFSVAPDIPLTVRDVMDLHRDHYEGTEFDMTKGLAAGPFGFPNRYYGPYDGMGDVGSPDRRLEGAWERPLSVAYIGYVYVNQGRSWLPDPVGGVCWMGCDRPSETCYVPFYAGTADLPECYQTVDTDRFDMQSAWWAFNLVSNWASLKYEYIIRDIRDMQDMIELAEIDSQRTVDSTFVEMWESDPGSAVSYLTVYTVSNAEDVVSRWWDFAGYLIAKYDDGYIMEPGQLHPQPRQVGYPEAWRDCVGYREGPVGYERPGGR